MTQVVILCHCSQRCANLIRGFCVWNDVKAKILSVPFWHVGSSARCHPERQRAYNSTQVEPITVTSHRISCHSNKREIFCVSQMEIVPEIGWLMMQYMLVWWKHWGSAEKSLADMTWQTRGSRSISSIPVHTPSQSPLSKRDLLTTGFFFISSVVSLSVALLPNRHSFV